MSAARWSCHFVNSQSFVCLAVWTRQPQWHRGSSGFKSRTFEGKRRRNEDVYLHCLCCCQRCALRPNFLKCLIMSSRLRRRKRSWRQQDLTFVEGMLKGIRWDFRWSWNRGGSLKEGSLENTNCNISWYVGTSGGQFPAQVGHVS